MVCSTRRGQTALQRPARAPARAPAHRSFFLYVAFSIIIDCTQLSKLTVHGKFASCEPAPPPHPVLCTMWELLKGYLVPPLVAARSRARAASSAAALFALAYTLAALYRRSATVLPGDDDDPPLFQPQQQDWFRTWLIGTLSPVLLQLVYKSVARIARVAPEGDERHEAAALARWLAFFKQTYATDSFMLLMIVCLAYPQRQEKPASTPLAQTWHILPRQSMVFGVSWALGEYAVVLTRNLHRFQEFQNSSSTGSLHQPHLQRTPSDVNLSWLVSHIRNNDPIAQNVYYQGNESVINGLASQVQTYDSMVQDAQPRKLVIKSRFGFQWVIKSNEPLPTSTDVKYKFLYAPGPSKYLMACTVMLSNIMRITSQSLLFSIYFMYVRTHDALFSNTVRFWGHHNIQFFLLCLCLPVAILHSLVQYYVIRSLDSEQDTRAIVIAFAHGIIILVLAHLALLY